MLAQYLDHCHVSDFLRSQIVVFFVQRPRDSLSADLVALAVVQ